MVRLRLVAFSSFLRNLLRSQFSIFCLIFHEVSSNTLKINRNNVKTTLTKKTNCPGEPEDHALGYSRGGYGTKVHIICDRKGLPLKVEVSRGQAHESKYFEVLVEGIEVKGRVGRPRKYPDKYAGDKGYSSQRVRDWLNNKGIEDVIARKENEQRGCYFNKRAYKRRNVVERCIGWLKESRRIATRYEKLAVHYLGMVKLGMILQYLWNY